MPNPLDHLYDELKVKYPDLVDRGEFVSKLSNEEELKKLHDAASKDIPGFVDFDNFKSKVGESLSTYDQDSDYKTQNTASTGQENAETVNPPSQQEESQQAPSEPQNSGIESEASVPDGSIDTSADAEAFDRETGDLDELGRRYDDKVKRLEGYGATEGLYANEEAARKHYEAYTRLLDEAEQDRLVYNRRVKAADREREEAERKEDLKSADDAKRLSAEYAGFTDKQYNEEVRRLNKEKDYLNSKQSQGDPRRGERIRSYNASITALAKEGDKRKAKAEAMDKRVKAVTSSPNVQKRYTSTDTLAYLFSGASPAALRNNRTALERAKTMTPEELIQGMETIASQDNPRGINPRVDAMLAGTFNAYLSQLSYLWGGDKPKDPTWARYDMMSRAMGDTQEDDNFITGVFNYLNGNEGYATAGYQTNPEERANIPQMAITDKFWELVEQEKSTQLERAGKTQMNGTLGDEIMKAQAMPGYSDPYAQAVVLDNQAEMLAQFNIDYDALLQKAIDSFGDQRIMEYAVSRAYVYDKTEDKSLNEVYQDIYDNTIGKVIGQYEPKNGYDFFMRQVWNTNTFSKIFQLGVRAKSGTLGKTDDYAAETAALERYAQDHQALTLGAKAFNFTVTEAPFFIATGGLSSMATQTAERALFGPAVKALSSSLLYRMGRGALASSLTGFQYGFVTDAVDRGLNEGTFDFAKTLSTSLHYGRDFAVMGAGGELFGVTNNMILRSAKDGRLNRLGATTLHFMNNAGKTLANATAVTGMYAFIDKPALERENKRIEAENKKISEENKSLPKDKQKPLKPLNEVAGVKDMFWSNITMFASLDAVHALRGMWGVARGRYDENMHNSGIHFDKYDREALKKVFGKNPNSLLRQIVFGQVDGVPAKWFEIDPEAEQEIYKELGRELTPAEKEAYATYGFTELRKVILDDRIPWVTRAKIVTAVTGRPVGMPPVMDADLTTVMGDDGHLKSVVVRSYDAAGTLIETREFSAKQAEKATSVYESLRSSAWRNNALLSGRLVLDAIEDKTYADTVDEMAREKGISSEQFEQMVFGIKQKDITGEKVTYRERQLVEEFDKRHIEKYDAEVKLTGPDALIEQVAREVYGEKWKAALKSVTGKRWSSMTPEDKEFIERYTDRLGRMGIAERTKMLASRPGWVRAVKEMEESVKRNREEPEVQVDESREEETPKKDSVAVEAPTRDEEEVQEDKVSEEEEPVKRESQEEPAKPAIEDEKVSVETPVEERVEPVPEVIELEEEKPAEPEPAKEDAPAEERLDAVRRTMKERGFHVNEYDDATLDYLEKILASDEIIPERYKPIVREYIDARREVERSKGAPAEEKPATVKPEQPATEGQPQAGTIGFEPVEQPTERERFDAERKEKAATITDADIEANREALGIPEGTALTDEARQIYAEDLAEDLMRYERFKRGESDEKARFHDYWESKFNPKRPKLEKPVEKQEEPVEEEEEEVTETDALIEQFDNLKGRSDLERYRNALKVFAGDDEIMAILEDLEPHDITEWVSSFLGLDSGKGYSMLWESKTRGGTVIAKGFKEETGWSWNDVKGFAFMFDNKNGMSPRRVAEKIWEELPSGIKDKYSDVDVFNIMMDLFGQSSRKSDLTGYIRNNRMEQVRELLNRRRSNELDEIARYKERERRGDEEPVAPPVSDDEEQNEFTVREDEVAPFSLLSLAYSHEEMKDGTLKSRFKARRQMETIGKVLGYKVQWVVDKPYNAMIDTEGKTLYINLRTDQPLAAVMGHEITHDLRKSDPKAYEALKRYAKDLLGQAQWDREVTDTKDFYGREYKRLGRNPFSEEKAEEEVVCDTMGKVLHTKKGLRELAGSLDPGVAGKVYRLLKDITDKVKSALGKEHDYSTMDLALRDFLNAVKQRAKKDMPIQDAPIEDDFDIDFSLRKKPAPKNTGVGYKVFYLKDGKLYPPMVANIGGEATPFGVWLDADAAPIAGKSKTGRNKVKAGGKGTQGGSGTLAYRPGWHLGKIPYALQFNRGRKVPNPLGILNKKGKVIDVGEFFPNDFVWAEVEYAADKDYQEEAHGYGVNANGKYNPSLAGLPRVPEDGSYEYRTNPNPATDPWIITGAMKVNRILKPSEVDAMVRAAGREPQKRQEGAFTDEQIDALNKQLNNTIGDTARNIQGLDGYTEQDVLDGVRGDIENKLNEAGIDGVAIKGMALHGSRMRGDARADSDLDVVVEYEGDISEDGLFNILNDEPMYFDGVKVDINPITRGKSGTLEQYMKRSHRYDEEHTSFSLKRDDRNAPTFYSNAARAVENVKQNKATAEQWKAMLTKAGGIKAGEDKWMGLSTWLDEHKGQTLTKEEVAQFVADNGIEMKEVNYAELVDEAVDEKLKPFVDEFNEFMDQAEEATGSMFVTDWANWANDQMHEKYGDDYFMAFELVEDRNHYPTIRPLRDVDGELVDAAKYFLGVGEYGDKDLPLDINNTRLDYTTPGLENKREIAFVVPDVEPYQEGDEVHFGPENQGRAVMWVRFGEARDADGKRVLVIDEIQSNRHQDAREKGYKVDEETAYAEYRKAISDYRDAEKRGNKDAMKDAEKRYEYYGAISGQLPGSRESYQGILKGAIPAAPFEKNWHEVAMKRMLRLAAEEGFDKVAWTTGEQQVDRYNLSHAVQSIAFNPEEDGSHSVFVTMQGGTMYEMVVGTDGMIESTRGNMFNGKNAVEVFGKEIAEKIMNSEEPIEFNGDDLRVGGYGMKAFYDGILPQFMDKYGKKWGVKVGEVTLNTPGRETMHSVDVNEDMKRSVMQGQPLFSLKREDSQKVFDTAKRKFGETKDIREAGYVLPDGSMLDFSGRHELDPGTDSSFLAGRRATDHRAINQISFVYDENGDEVDTGVSSDMSDFIKRGAIRIDNNAGSINLSAAPTMAQRRVLRELIRRNGGDVQVDFGDGWNSDHYVEYEEASAQRVLGDIDRYFDEGIKPEGNAQFSLKKETRTDADGNEVYTETREDGTKDREITTYGDGSKKALWYDDKGNLKERLDYFPNGEVSQVANYDRDGNLTRNIQYDENRRTTSYYLPAIGTDWKLDENGIARGKSNGVEIKPYNFQFSLKTYHGSGADFDRFDHDYVGSGEGAQAYGWGTYVTEVEGIGRRYAMIDYRRDGSRNHFLYSVEIPDEKEGKYLPYGERVIDPKVRKVLTDRLQQMADEYWNGEIPSYKLTELDKALNTFMPRDIASVLECSDKEVSQLLSKAGYTGVKYVANVFNRGQKGLSYNYVIFNEKDLGITDKEQFSLKRRRNRDDYTDEDRADAAIIANTYLAQADALRQQIEADREREHQLVEERNRLLAFDYPAADPADRPAIMDRINALRNQINDLRNANYENNTKLRSMDYEYRVAKEILEQGAVTDEEAARFDAGQMTREEKVLESLFKAAADSRADKKAKQKAIRSLVRELAAITDNFKAAMKARGIESQRKHYDKGTVDHIIRLAKAMMGTGYIDNMTSYEVKRLMGMINNAATRESIETQAGRIVDMMLDHQIRTLRKDFDKQLKVTGQKTNSSGVQVQAGLDQEGQVVMDSYRKSMEIIADSAGKREEKDGELTEWGEFYNKTLNDMGDADPVKAEQARKIFTGVLLAERWFNDVRAMEINDRILRSKIEDFKADNKPAKDADADTKQRYNDALADYQEMLRQNKIKIIEAYERITGDVGMTQAESVRRAKEFAEAQKQRVEEIQHNANSDLQDVDDKTQVKTPESRIFGANKNNVIVRLLFESAGTYEKFMRFFGRMAPNGEGYLFKRFMTQYHHARQDYWKGRHSAFEEMDKKMAEVFGKKKMHWSDIYEMTRDHKKFPTITVSYWDGYRNGQPFRREDELNQSEALYLYMINKMPDGRMKLRKMGITDDKVQQMAGEIDGRLIQLADWLQSEFLPKMRVKYNETHKRVFGADMAAIEDYFPLRINELAVTSNMDITERDMNDNKPSTITGAIVKRRVNTKPIDLHTDAFDVALSHVDEMEHWAAYAEFNRDNNTLVNYNRFRTKVNNMKSLEFGAGKVLWKNFTNAVAIAADAYHPKAGKWGGDYYSTRVAKFVSTAKIALRPYTALKQLLSIPAFWADSDPLEQFKATVNVADTWQWAIENLPGFAERWQSRQAGNIKLANYNDLSGLRRRKAMRKLQRAGMWANAAIDGLACAMGGKAVYETKLKRYRKMGYDEARAQEKALIDAAIAYNNSQQSSEGAYVSPLQVDRTWYANAFSVFRSASMGYTRRLNTSLRQLRNATFKRGYGAQSVEFLKKQMMRDGLTEEQAEKWAHRIYRRANLKAAASVAIFGQILPFTWNLSANMFYLLFGKDDKEKKKILADSFRHSFFGPIEGLVGGNIYSELGDIAADTAIGKIWGDSIWGDSNAFKTLGYRDFSTMPFSSDINNVLKYFARDEVKAANEVVNILFQVATGVNLQTITDWVTAILDLSRSDMERRDIAMFAMRLLSTPQSQLDKFYLDQMNISQEQADKMSVDDLIKRYATYKRWRETPLTGWMYSDEREKKVEEKFQKSYEEMLEERAVAEEGLRGTINKMTDLPRKRTMMDKLQKELTDSIEATDPELYKKALEGEKADDDEYVRRVTDKDVELMAELQMKKKALKEAHDRKTKADKDFLAYKISVDEYHKICDEVALDWKLYNMMGTGLSNKINEMKDTMEQSDSKLTPEEAMDSIRTLYRNALNWTQDDAKKQLKKDKDKYKKRKKKK